MWYTCKIIAQTLCLKLDLEKGGRQSQVVVNSKSHAFPRWHMPGSRGILKCSGVHYEEVTLWWRLIHFYVYCCLILFFVQSSLFLFALHVHYCYEKIFLTLKPVQNVYNKQAFMLGAVFLYSPCNITLAINANNETQVQAAGITSVL